MSRFAAVRGCTPIPRAPNHLGQEVIDNSVDEALAGHAKRVDVILHADQSLEVIDDGRGMPVDIHPEEGVPAVELILCRLHAGGKFSNKNYQFSGGLHGVGISVVNALSRRVEVTVRRDGQVYSIAFENGEKVQDLQVIGTCGKRNTGTSVHFWPDESFFDSPRFSVSRLTHLLKAKAVLCPGVEITFKDEVNNAEQRWCYRGWSQRLPVRGRLTACRRCRKNPLLALSPLETGSGGLGAAVAAGRWRTADGKLR